VPVALVSRARLGLTWKQVQDPPVWLYARGANAKARIAVRHQARSSRAAAKKKT
jgi:hypothetical protein